MYNVYRTKHYSTLVGVVELLYFGLWWSYFVFARGEARLHRQYCLKISYKNARWPTQKNRSSIDLTMYIMCELYIMPADGYKKL